MYNRYSYLNFEMKIKNDNILVYNQSSIVIGNGGADYKRQPFSAVRHTQRQFKRRQQQEAHLNFNNKKHHLRQTTMSATIEPASVQVPAAGGTSNHTLQNTNAEVEDFFLTD